MKIGKPLALRVAAHLKTKTDLMYSHRDYCGMGLTWYRGQFIYCRVYDGYPADTVLSFTDEEKFVDWLAEQSDQSLSGAEEKDQFYKNNQRITQERLFNFVSGRPSPRQGE